MHVGVVDVNEPSCLSDERFVLVLYGGVPDGVFSMAEAPTNGVCDCLSHLGK
jgi:hypothetical protein